MAVNVFYLQEVFLFEIQYNYLWNVLYEIKLQQTLKPANPFMKNLFVFITISFFLFPGCTKTGDSPTVLAEYTLGNGGDCNGEIVSGRFVADTALTGANTVTITVDVTVPGPYWISTNTVNGISFSQASTFMSTGSQTAVLTGTGTPIATDTANFTVTALNGSGDSCTFSVATVKGILPPTFLTCFFNGVYRNFVDSAVANNSDSAGNSGITGLYIRGLDTVLNSNSMIEFGVGSTGSVGMGTYTDTSFVKAYFDYVDSVGEMWSVHDSGDLSFKVVVTSASAGNVQGTFTGTIKNSMNTDSISVTNGLFSVPVQ